MTPPDTCPGVLRDELTPETLRVLFQRKGNTIWQDDMLELEGNRHASAWAADRARIEALERLAAAEHDRGDYLAGAEPVGGTESLYLRLDAARKEVEALATREKALCRHCGKPESNSKHTRYGPDLDNPVKHEFEPPEQTLPDELTPETLRAVFHALWHSRMLVPGPTEEDCLAHVSAWAADRRDAALEKRDKLQRAEESVVLRARIEALERWGECASQALVYAATVTRPGMDEDTARLVDKTCMDLDLEWAALRGGEGGDAWLGAGAATSPPNRGRTTVMGAVM